MQLLTKFKKILHMGFRAALKFSKNQLSLERFEGGLVSCLGCALRFAQEASTVTLGAAKGAHVQAGRRQLRKPPGHWHSRARLGLRPTTP